MGYLLIALLVIIAVGLISWHRHDIIRWKNMQEEIAIRRKLVVCEGLANWTIEHLSNIEKEMQRVGEKAAIKVLRTNVANLKRERDTLVLDNDDAIHIKKKMDVALHAAENYLTHYKG